MRPGILFFSPQVAQQSLRLPQEQPTWRPSLPQSGMALRPQHSPDTNPSDGHNPAQLPACGHLGNLPGIPHPCPEDSGTRPPEPGICPVTYPSLPAGNPGASAALSSFPLIWLLYATTRHGEPACLPAFAHAVPTAQHAFSCLPAPTCQSTLPHPKLTQGLHCPRKRCLAHYTYCLCLECSPLRQRARPKTANGASTNWSIDGVVVTSHLCLSVPLCGHDSSG